MAKMVGGTLIQLKQKKKQRDFTILPNTLIRDRGLDWAPLGLLVDLLHLHPEQTVSLQWLCNRRPSGKDATTTAVKKLRALGYLLCETMRDANGKITAHKWTVSESPVQEWKDDFARHCRRKNPESAFPHLDAATIPESAFPHLDATASIPESAFPHPEKPEPGKATTKKISTRQKQNTTTGGWLDWSFLGTLRKDVRLVVEKLISSLEVETQQQLLDELAGALIGTKPPARPVAWLRACVRRAQRGEFRPDAGEHIVAARLHRTSIEREIARRREESEAQHFRSRTPAALAAASAAKTAVARL